MGSDDDILTVAEVAEYLRLNPQTVYRLTQQGQLPGFKVGRHWRFSRRHIEDWMKAKVRQPRADGADPEQGGPEASLWESGAGIGARQEL